MKKTSLIISALVLLMGCETFAETVHQSTQGDEAYCSDGGKALEKGLIEVKSTPEAEEGKIAQVKGSVPQWGFVSYWFGIPTPAGKATLRIRLYVDDKPVADYGAYVITSAGQILVGKIKIPEGTKAGAFVDVEIPVDSKDEWNGVAIKKFEQSASPSPWIKSLSVILP